MLDPKARFIVFGAHQVGGLPVSIDDLPHHPLVCGEIYMLRVLVDQGQNSRSGLQSNVKTLSLILQAVFYVTQVVRSSVCVGQWCVYLLSIGAEM